MLDELHTLHARVCGPDALATALGMARDTIDTCCATRHLGRQPPAQPPPFTAGGLVLHDPTPHGFADRLLWLPGIHDCAPAPSLSRSCG